MAKRRGRAENRALRFLYRTVPGRVLLRGLTKPAVSRVCGRYMDSRFSRRKIRGFARRSGIRLEDYRRREYNSFNDFFTRRIRPELRPVDFRPGDLIAPCDGALSAYRISADARFPIKGSTYSVSELLGGDPAAGRYDGGVCLVFRLDVSDYHRYCYLDDGVKGPNVYLPGRLNTVQPIALACRPVFVQNCREYTVMRTEHFGTVTEIEVGALLVGKIRNFHGPGRIRRGVEKGMFLYGGSTVVLLLERDAAVLPDALWRTTARGGETPVRYGQKIGEAVRRGRKT